ncbi:MAG: Gfo/Idh/MocA family oxidoreductase [Victivallaceae bacterium]
MKQMSVAIIGTCGHIGYALAGIRKNLELTVCGISSADECDIKPALNEELAAEFNCGFYENYHELLERQQPDVAVIATRYDLNGKVSLDCLNRGINCFTEKSIAHDFATLEAICAAATKNQANIIGMHGMRYDPEYYAVYQAVKQGSIGKPMLFAGQKSYKFGNGRPEFYKKREFYGGTILWVAVHALDWAYWMMGDFDSIHAIHSAENNFGYGECEATAAMSFGFKSGAMGTVSADYYQPQKAKFHGGDRLRIAGDKGVITIHEQKAYLTTHEQERHELAQEDGDFFGDFCRELNGEGVCRLSMEDTFRVTEIGLYARESADKHKLVQL